MKTKIKQIASTTGSLFIIGPVIAFISSFVAVNVFTLIVIGIEKLFSFLENGNIILVDWSKFFVSSVEYSVIAAMFGVVASIFYVAMSHLTDTQVRSKIFLQSIPGLFIVIMLFTSYLINLLKTIAL